MNTLNLASSNKIAITFFAPNNKTCAPPAVGSPNANTLEELYELHNAKSFPAGWSPCQFANNRRGKSNVIAPQPVVVLDVDADTNPSTLIELFSKYRGFICSTPGSTTQCKKFRVVLETSVPWDPETKKQFSQQQPVPGLDHAVAGDGARFWYFGNPQRSDWVVVKKYGDKPVPDGEPYFYNHWLGGTEYPQPPGIWWQDKIKNAPPGTRHNTLISVMAAVKKSGGDAAAVRLFSEECWGKSQDVGRVEKWVEQNVDGRFKTENGFLWKYTKNGWEKICLDPQFRRWGRLDGDRFGDIYADICDTIVKLDTTDSRALSEICSKTGAPPKKIWEYIQEVILNTQPVVCYKKSGWYGDEFVWGTDTTLVNSFAVGEKFTLKKCSIDDWTHNLLTAQLNEHEVFALGFALGSVLAETSGVLHLNGQSSMGKTLALKMATAAFGYTCSQWLATGNGLEGALEHRSFGCLGLDESGQFPGKPQELEEIIYRIGNGTGKARATQSGDEKPRKTWTAHVLSTGETHFDLQKAGADIRCVQLEFKGTPRNTEQINAMKFCGNHMPAGLLLKFAQMFKKSFQLRTPLGDNNQSRRVWRMFDLAHQAIECLNKLLGIDLHCDFEMFFKLWESNTFEDKTDHAIELEKTQNYILEEIQKNIGAFQDDCKTTRWGRIVNGKTYEIFISKFKQLCQGRNWQIVLSEMSSAKTTTWCRYHGKTIQGLRKTNGVYYVVLEPEDGDQNLVDPLPY